MDPVNIEMVIFDVGGFSFGTEVSQIISILRPCEEKMKQIDESIQLVDLSMRLGIGGTESQKARKPEGRRAGFPAFWPSKDLSTESTGGNGTVVFLVDTPAGTRGVYVESVRGIVKMPLEQIEPVPGFLKSRIQTDCIWGIGKLKEELVILLDLDRYLLDAGC